MEYLEKVLKKTGWSSLISSIIFAVLGIVLITNPEGTVKFVSYILGIIFILIGLYKVANYLSNKGKLDFYNYDMAFGVIAIILGIITIAFSNQIGNIFRILIGLWIIYSSIIRINFSFKFKNINSSIWIGSLIISIIMFICGIYIISNSGAIIVTIGIVVLAYAILDIIESLLFLSNINKMS